MEHPTRIYTVAAACLGLYLAAQIAQLILMRGFLPPQGPEQEMLARLAPAETLRAVLMLLSHLCLVPVYMALAMRRWRAAPGAAACGAVFGVAFVLFEVAYRTLDLFLVSQGWAAAYASADAAERAALIERVALWKQAVGAWYFSLLAAHLLASLSFLAAFRPGEPGTWNLLAQIALGLNALRLAGRLLGGWGGVDWLAVLSGRFYFPPMATVLILLTVWMVRQAILERRVRR